MTANPPAGVDAPPTTCTRISSAPPASAIRAATALVPSIVIMSASMNRSGCSYPAGIVRADTYTSAPISRSLSTTALPEPFDPPVTSALRPSRRSRSEPDIRSGPVVGDDEFGDEVVPQREPVVELGD